MKLLYIDLFCGAGGTSTGVSSARINGEKCADVIACVNHDVNAIASHASNHPNALHFFIENYCIINGKKIKLTDTQKEYLKLIGSGKRICHIKHRC